jgi:hypothetical protein
MSRLKLGRGISTILAVKAIKAADTKTTAWLEQYNCEGHIDTKESIVIEFFLLDIFLSFFFGHETRRTGIISLG